MTIFIFSFGTAFCHARRNARAWARGLSAWLILCVCAAPAHAVRLPFAKDHAQDKAQGDMLYQQAFASYQTGDYKQALTQIEKADALKPDQSDGWNLRGMVFLKQNAFDKAEAAFARAMVLDPKLWAAQFNFAEAPFQGRDYARARPRFEKLADQTDRYKEAKKWELVQYKAFLSALLMGDDAGAAKKLAKLPAKGGMTPAHQYAQAAMLFSHKDAAGARKSLAEAQTSYPAPLNDLFSNSLVEVGWEAPAPTFAPPPPAGLPGQSSHVPSQEEMAASSSQLAPLPADAPKFADKYAPIVVDPKMEAAAADPLPTGDAGARPMMQKVTPHPAPAPVRVTNAPAPPALSTPPPSDAPDHRGLLLE